MVFVVEIGDYKVWLTVSVDISSVNSHARLRMTARIIGKLGVDRKILKRAIPLVEEKQIRRRITGHEEIGPAIIIHVDGYKAEGAPDQFCESAFLAHIGECAVTIVVIESERHTRISFLFTVSAQAVEFALLDLIEREAGIVGYDEIQIAVPVKIKPSRTCRPPPSILHSCKVCNVSEGSVAIVMEERA